MLTWIREKFGTVLIGGIIAFIAFVFVFYGVFSPKSTRGLHEGAVAGTVNGDPISISEFNREVNRRIEMFKNMSGGKFTDEQIRNFRIKDGVFQELVNRKLLIQEAKKQGLDASDEEVREKVKEIPAFQKDGKFSVTAYKEVLDANHYTPSSFERLVREDIAMQQWEQYFQTRVRVSQEELNRDFLMTNEKRNIKYVALTPETGKKSVEVTPDELKKFMADPAQQNLIKMKYDAEKASVYKGQTLEKAKEDIAKGILAGQKMDAIQKVNEGLAAQILPLLTADTGKDTAPNDSKILALLKPYDLKIERSGLVSKQSEFIPGLGDVKELLKDAFGPVGAQKKPKIYHSAGKVIVAVVTESQSPNLADFEKQKASQMNQMHSRKVRQVYQDWMKNLTTKAKVDQNAAVVAGNEGGE